MSDLQDRDLLRSLAQRAPGGEPDYQQMIMGGMARGRRRRLVRRVLQSVAGAGVAAAVGVTAFAVTSFPTATPGNHVDPAGGPTAAAKPTPGPQEEAKKRAAEEAHPSEGSKVDDGKKGEAEAEKKAVEPSEGPAEAPDKERVAHKAKAADQATKVAAEESAKAEARATAAAEKRIPNSTTSPRPGKR